jgi:hypothetical protein
MTDPTPERIRELFDVDFDTGELVWKVSRGRAKAGDVAGWIGSEGYRCVQIDGRAYLVHRLIAITAGWELDHLTGRRHRG